MTERLDKPHTFEMLDGIRGLAALLVAERHLAFYFYHKQLPGSYLAVDIFFVLSGFVLAHAYEPRFAAGLRWGKFLLMRLIRLYPLYLVGMVLGLLNLWLGSSQLLPEGYLPLATLMAVLFLPLMITPPAATAGTLYPLDHPTWTLLFELMANVLHAMLAARLSNRVLHGLIIVSAALMIAAAFHFGYLDMGYRAADFVAGIPRVCFSYFLGVRLYRLWRSRVVHSVAAAWAVIVGIIGVMFLPLPPEYRLTYDLLAVLLLIPALVYYGASVQLGGWSRKVLLPLGTASYAYYVLHVPFGLLCDTIGRRVGVDLPAAAPWGGVLVLVALLGVSLTLDAYYDLPLRRWLARRLL